MLIFFKFFLEVKMSRIVRSPAREAMLLWLGWLGFGILSFFAEAEFWTPGGQHRNMEAQTFFVPNLIEP